MDYILNYEKHRLNIHSYLENMFKYTECIFCDKFCEYNAEQIANISYPCRAAYKGNT